MNPTRIVLLFLVVQTIVFLSAAIAHLSGLINGTVDTAAGTAESLIGLVLSAGLSVTIVQRRLIRSVGLGVQVFALLGTLVGVFTIIVGVGPRTVPDLIIHGTMLVLLVPGIAVTQRTTITRTVSSG